ncbi:MAG TPA: SRPBCC family protein [Euzebyales bacterium]
MTTTRVTRVIRAPRVDVYRALIDGEAVERWMVPEGMASHVHAFDARRGGAFRISLTYDAPIGTGKTSERTDSYHGTFVELVPGRKVVQRIEFESDDPAMQGPMTVTYLLADVDGDTEIVGVHEDLPPGISPADNELGWTMSLGKLARLVEGHVDTSPPDDQR